MGYIMSKKFVKPNIVVSKCIEFDFCRYNGQIIRNEFVRKLKDFVNFIPVCPEVEIGLGIPRDSIRIVEKDGKRLLIQPSTENDVTEKMIIFSKNFLNKLENIDGFILKSQSPSCGIKDVKIYPNSKNSAPKFRDKGIFGRKVIEKHQHLAIEDENRLRNTIIKEHFLKKIYTFAAFRDIKDTKKIKDLIDFHTKNKYLLMSYNQKNLKIMGNLIANWNKEPIENIIDKYEKILYGTFSRGSRCNSNINILQHAFGYFSKHIAKKEKEMLLANIKKYSGKQTSLEIPIALLKSWIIRFDEPYLKKQTYFEPYPPELHEPEAVTICPSKDYWK
jgi:uncharacterized protein YbgA (DUF1722 family)/uncharacterized protein YbbK (DUF523 family)